MQGRGVTNFSTSKPTHSYTTSTTEFDDALLERGIINFEQAMMAKGATYEEAKRLSALKRNGQKKGTHTQSRKGDENNEEMMENNNDRVDDDDEFLRKYRAMRLNQLRKEKYGSVIPIQRNEWNHQVNNASQDGTWVVINLTAQKSSPNLNPNHKDICVLIEDNTIPHLATKYPAVKFVSIPSTSAIENFPDSNLPTLFCYRYGKLQCQMIGLEQFGIRGSNRQIISREIEFRLGRMGVLGDQFDTEDSDDESNGPIPSDNNGYSRSHFDGKMAQLQTGNDDGESDYDDVD